MTNEIQLFTVNEVCIIMRISRSKLYRLISHGDFPDAVMIGKKKVWTRSVLDSFINSGGSNKTE